MPVSTRRSKSSSTSAPRYFQSPGDDGSCLKSVIRSSHESINLFDSAGRPRCAIESSNRKEDSHQDVVKAESTSTGSPPILGAYNWVRGDDHRGSRSKANTPRYTGKENALSKVTRSLQGKFGDPLPKANGRIMVYVRIRPMSGKEKEAGAQCCIRSQDSHQVHITEFAQETDYLRLKRLRGRHFNFDAVFPENAAQQEVYNASTAKLVETVLQGQNCSVFCYGATGAGKTYTMLGSVENPGIMVLALTDLFTKLKRQSDFTVRLSYLEVYNESVRDLLSPGQVLVLREDSKQGITASGLTQYVAHSAEEVMALLQKGNQNRQTEPTRMNETSSRSHAILQVEAEHRSTTEIGCISRIGKLSLIDLAGSERALATDQRTLRSLEGANINRSLLALSSCINALVEGKKHIPFRNSKLTQLLKDSLGGSCQTAMIANISPSSLQFAETQNTLHWADRAKKIRTKACAHEELEIPSSKQDQAKLLLQMQKENRELKLEIARLRQQKEEDVKSEQATYVQSVMRSSSENQKNAQWTISELRKALVFLETEAERSHSSKADESIMKMKVEADERNLEQHELPSLLVSSGHRPMTRLLAQRIKEEKLRRMSQGFPSLYNPKVGWELPGPSSALSKKRNFCEFDRDSITNSLRRSIRRRETRSASTSTFDSLLLQQAACLLSSTVPG